MSNPYAEHRQSEAIQRSAKALERIADTLERYAAALGGIDVSPRSLALNSLNDAFGNVQVPCDIHVSFTIKNPALDAGSRGSVNLGLCPTSDIFSMCDGLQMVGVHTSAIAAQMVNLQTVWDWAHHCLVHEHMGVDAPIVDLDFAVSVVGGLAVPLPASGFGDDRIRPAGAMVSRNVVNRVSSDGTVPDARRGCDGGLTPASAHTKTGRIRRLNPSRIDHGCMSARPVTESLYRSRVGNVRSAVFTFARRGILGMHVNLTRSCAMPRRVAALPGLSCAAILPDFGNVVGFCEGGV